MTKMNSSRAARSIPTEHFSRLRTSYRKGVTEEEYEDLMRRARQEDKDVREIIKKDEMQLLESANVFSIRINQHSGCFKEHKMGDAVKINQASTETYARSAALLHQNMDLDFNQPLKPRQHYEGISGKLHQETALNWMC